MKRLILIAMVGIPAWQGCANDQPSPTPATQPQRASTNKFKCDGRQHCSQMSSCEEATYFLKNCPGVKMDGDNDGVPCESQWCE